jgi:hypothetical protein
VHQQDVHRQLIEAFVRESFPSHGILVENVRQQHGCAFL